MKKIKHMIKKYILLIFLLFLPIHQSIAEPELITKTIDFDDCPSKHLGQCYLEDGVSFYQSIRMVHKEVFPKFQFGIGEDAVEFETSVLTGESGTNFIVEFYRQVKKVKISGAPLLNYDNYEKQHFLVMKAYNQKKEKIAESAKKLTGESDSLSLASIEVNAPAKEYIRYITLEIIVQYDSGEKRHISIYADDLVYWYEDGSTASNIKKPDVTILSASISKEGYLNLSGKILAEGISFLMNPPLVRIFQNCPPNYSIICEIEIPLLLDDNLWEVVSDSYTFSLKYRLSFLGNVEVTAEAQNPKGFDSDSKTLSYLPIEITNKANQLKSILGDFQYGEDGASCKIAIFQHGAISLDAKMDTHGILGNTFEKWSQHKKLLGCPLAEERNPIGHRWGDEPQTSVSIGDALLQDFSGGRIYSGPRGEFYVIEPFLDAIKKFDFDVNFGIPVTDPIRNIVPFGLDIFYPKLWQRFEVTNSNQYYNLDYSAMEITSNPDTLWIATPDLLGWLRSNTDAEIVWDAEISNSYAYDKSVDIVPSRLPTVWREYRYDQKSKKYSDVGIIPTFGVPAHAEVTPHSELSNTCFNDEYGTAEGASEVFGYCPKPAQWMQIIPDKITSTLGTVKRIGLSSTDFGANHYCIVGVGDKGVDINLILLPDPGYEKILGEKQLHEYKLEVEYEWCFAGFPSPIDSNNQYGKGPNTNQVQKGDRLFIAGRWIADCGHEFKSEIHPPSIMVNMYSSFDKNNKVTVGDFLDFGWWYHSSDVNVNIFPPPRPTSLSEITISTPLSSVFKGSGSFLSSTFHNNHIEAVFGERKDLPGSYLENCGLMLFGNALSKSKKEWELLFQMYPGSMPTYIKELEPREFSISEFKLGWQPSRYLLQIE